MIDDPLTKDEQTKRDANEARERARYLARKHPELRDEVALALAYRELGYTASGIAKCPGITVTEGTVNNWLDRIAARFGMRAIETKWREQRKGPLDEPTTETLAEELSAGVLADYLAIAKDNPEHVPDAVDIEELAESDDADPYAYHYTPDAPEPEADEPAEAVPAAPEEPDGNGGDDPTGEHTDSEWTRWQTDNSADGKQ